MSRPGLSSETGPAFTRIRGSVQQLDEISKRLWQSPVAEHVTSTVVNALLLSVACNSLIESLGLDPQEVAHEFHDSSDRQEFINRVFKLVLRK